VTVNTFGTNDAGPYRKESELKQILTRLKIVVQSGKFLQLDEDEIEKIFNLILQDEYHHLDGIHLAQLRDLPSSKKLEMIHQMIQFDYSTVDRARQGSEKSPLYYVTFLKDWAFAKSKNHSVLEFVSKKVKEAMNPTAQLDVLVDLRVQCSCGTVK
jgi:hypothetical protein